MFNMTPALRAVALTAVTLAASTALLTIEASARGNHGMSNMGGMRSSTQFRPMIRDHRTSMPRVVVRDHRTLKVVSRPIIRDHRTPVASNTPIVRDHRGDGPIIRDHRGDGATAPGGPVKPTPGGPARPVDVSGAPGGVTVTPTPGRPIVRDHRDVANAGGTTVNPPPVVGGNPRSPVIAPPSPPPASPPGVRPPSVVPPLVANPPVVSPPGGGVRPPSVNPPVVQPVPPQVADPRPPTGPGVITDPCLGASCGNHPPRPDRPHHPHHPHHFSGGPAVILATTVVDDGCIYEWRNRYAQNGTPIAYKVKVCPMIEEVR